MRTGAGKYFDTGFEGAVNGRGWRACAAPSIEELGLRVCPYWVLRPYPWAGLRMWKAGGGCWSELSKTSERDARPEELHDVTRTS